MALGASRRDCGTSTNVVRIPNVRREKVHISVTPARIDVFPQLRCLSLVAIATMLLAVHPAPCHSTEETNPYILELLKKTEENRDRRRAENLEHYTNKVFSDYFDFTGPVSPELQAEIDNWRTEHLNQDKTRR